MSPSSLLQKFKLHSTVSFFTSNIRPHHHHTNVNTITITRCFSSNFTKGVDWTKRRKILRIAKYKQKQSFLKHTEEAKKKPKQIRIEHETEQQNEKESDDIFLDSVVNPGNSKTNFVKRKYDKIHGITDDSETVEYKFRPALLTKMIKGTRSPQKLLTLWLRDREQCRIDHINTSAAIVHLAQLCLEKLQPQQIYEKTMSWSLIRLIRDVHSFTEDYAMRQVANIMWSVGVLTSNNNDNITGGETQKIHRDFRRLTAKLLARFETDIEIRRKCNVQNMCDMLWTMNCVGLKVHKFFYQFCIDLYCKLDIDIGVTPDALAYLSVLFAVRSKLNEKIKNDAVYNDVIPKEFWLKLLREFCDDFVLIEAEPHHIANILWSFGRIGNKVFMDRNAMEEEWIISSVNKLLTFVQHRLADSDGQTLSILLWCVTCSNFPALMICKKHAIFDYEKEMSIGQRILQLIEAQHCHIIPARNTNLNERYSNKAYNISLNDCIVIFEAITKGMEYCIPAHILRLMLNRMKEQLKYSTLSVRELICLLESVNKLGLNDDIFHGIMSKKLVNGIRERSKNEWNYSEFIGLLTVINEHEILYKNLDLVYCVLSALQLSKQGWGQMDCAPIQLLYQEFIALEKSLLDNAFIINVDDNQDLDVNNNNPANLSVLVAAIRHKIDKRLDHEVLK